MGSLHRREALFVHLQVETSPVEIRWCNCESPSIISIHTYCGNCSFTIKQCQMCEAHFTSRMNNTDSNCLSCRMAARLAVNT